jgi:hypothetical protein
MAKMGKYCKAYYIRDLRAFEGWTENSKNARKEKKQIDGKEVEVARELTDNDFLFLQENFIVADGILLDENVIFDQVTPKWVAFCKETLKFEVPDYEAADN